MNSDQDIDGQKGPVEVAHCGCSSTGAKTANKTFKGYDNDDDSTQDSTTTNSTTNSADMSVSPSSFNNRDNPASRSTWNGSLVEYYGPSSSHCGYCKRTANQADGGTRRSYDMQSYRLTPNDYQDFLDRGWRRSGEFCYNPINQTTCCPNFSITCSAIKFKLSRSQRKCIEKLNNFLVTDSMKQKSLIDYGKNDTDYILFNVGQQSHKNHKQSTRDNQETIDCLKASSKARRRRYVKACERIASREQLTFEDAMQRVKTKWEQRRPREYSLEDYLYPRISKHEQEDSEQFEVKHKLEINLVHIDSKHSRDLRKQEHEIMVKYQKVVHKETSREWTMLRYLEFLVYTPIELERLRNYDYLPTSVDEEDETSRDNLSRDVHNEANISFKLHRPPQLPTAYGTYHCNYHLDGKLIATGVLDVLPKCVTTVYFFYDPQYAFLNLGVYSALVEISLVRQMWYRFKAPEPVQSDSNSTSSVSNCSENLLKYYYLGYYVHECKKMHYKTKFKPSYLLCCKTFKYVQTEKCLERLKDRKYTNFYEITEREETAESSSADDSIEFQKLLGVTIEWPQEISDQFQSSNTKLLDYLLWLEANLGTGYVELFVNGYLATFAHLVGPDLLAKLCLKTNIVHRTLIRRRNRLLQ